VSDVEKKWGNLRTQYQKHFNNSKGKQPSGSGVDESKVKWRFFRLLNFLAPTVQNTSVRRCNLQVWY